MHRVEDRVFVYRQDPRSILARSRPFFLMQSIPCTAYEYLNTLFLIGLAVGVALAFLEINTLGFFCTYHFFKTSVGWVEMKRDPFNMSSALTVHETSLCVLTGVLSYSSRNLATLSHII